jgi:oligopeptide transport system substrate-binding protein
VLDSQTLRIRLEGKYPQFQYWLAMPFFAPMPWEADVFYAQPGLAERNITLDWYPVGTGPYMLSENDPNLRMVLERNPNFHGETYPSEGMPEDRDSGILNDAGQPIPLVDRAIYSLEKEDIPRWTKFLQGYYDASGISSDAFDQAIQIDASGEPILTEVMRERGISLLTSVEPSIFYIGFNMLDPVIGGDSSVRVSYAGRSRSRSTSRNSSRSSPTGAVWWPRVRCRPGSSAIAKARRGSIPSSTNGATVALSAAASTRRRC